MGPMQPAAMVSGPSSLGHWGRMKPQQLLQRGGWMDVGRCRRSAIDKDGAGGASSGAQTPLQAAPLSQSFCADLVEEAGVGRVADSWRATASRLRAKHARLPHGTGAMQMPRHEDPADWHPRRSYKAIKRPAASGVKDRLTLISRSCLSSAQGVDKNPSFGLKVCSAMDGARLSAAFCWN